MFSTVFKVEEELEVGSDRGAWLLFSFFNRSYEARREWDGVLARCCTPVSCDGLQAVLRVRRGMDLKDKPRVTMKVVKKPRFC